MEVTLPREQRFGAGPAAAAGIAAVGCVVVGVLLQHLSDRPTGTIEWPIDLAFGLVTIGSGAAVWHRRPDTPIGRRMVVAGFLMYAEVLLRSNDGWLFTVGNLLAGASAALLAHVVVTYPSGRAETRLERVVVVSGYALVAFFCLARAATTDFGPTCFRCPPNHFYLGGYPGVFDTLNTVSAALVVLLASGVAAVLAAKWRRAGHASRRVLAPLYASVLLMLTATAATRPTFDNRGPTSGGGLALSLAFWTFPIAVAVGLLRGHLARAAASDLLVDLAHDGDLEAAVARALDDPTVRLLRWHESTSTYRDADGRVAGDLASGRGRAIIEREGRQLAIVEHDAVLAEEPERLTAVLSAIGLALDRARLAEAVRVQLDEVASSRARIVTAADEERRRIERNLHDGAQQRLVGVSMLVRRARSRALSHGDREQAQLLADAAEELDRSLREIRELARGLQPPLLAEHGLLAALESLAEGSAVPTVVRGHLDTRPSMTTEAAAFFVASECLANAAKHAAATSALITVDCDGDHLVITVADDGHGGAVLINGSGLRGLRDRVEALDGDLEVRSSHDTGTVVSARIPLSVR